MGLDYFKIMDTQNKYLDEFKGITNDLCFISYPDKKKYLNKAEETLGYSLPTEFKDFYLHTNGLRFFYWNQSQSLYVNMKVFPIQRVFGGWKKKKDGTLGLKTNNDWSIDIFNGTLWFDHYINLMKSNEFELIKRLKVLESIEGLSAWITIDFVPNEKYQLYLVYKTDIIPINITFEQYVNYSLQFCGLPNWWALFLKTNFDFWDLKKIKAQIKKYFPQSSHLINDIKVK